MSTTERGLILAYASSKGGVTKSTLGENSAVEFARRGYSVAVVDADHQQKTISKWADRRNDSIEEGKNWQSIPCFIKAGRIKNDLLELAKNYDVVIVDSGGRESVELRVVLSTADIIYIPLEVSINCLEALEEFEGTIIETEELNPDRIIRGMLVTTPTNPNNKEKQEAKEYLKSFSDLLVMSPCKTTMRTAYRLAPRIGGSVIEQTKDSTAKAEIQLLVQEIIKHAAK